MNQKATLHLIQAGDATFDQTSITPATWDNVRAEYGKMTQMGFQSVLQAARVGAMLIELKAEDDNKRKTQGGRQNFSQLCEKFVPEINKDTRARLMTLAMHTGLLAQHQPESQSAALALIKAQRPKNIKHAGKDNHIGWVNLLVDRFGLRHGQLRANREKLIEVMGFFPAYFDDPAAADEFVERYIRIIGAPKDKQTRAELNAAQQKKLDTAIKIEFARLDKKYSEAAKIQVNAEVERLVATIKSSYKKLNQEAEETEARYKAAIATIDAYMTEDEYKLILNCLHPDRAPEDRRQRFNDAFVIFRRMETYVNRKVPMSTLRERGWAR